MERTKSEKSCKLYARSLGGDVFAATTHASTDKATVSTIWNPILTPEANKRPTEVHRFHRFSLMFELFFRHQRFRCHPPEEADQRKLQPQQRIQSC